MSQRSTTPSGKVVHERLAILSCIHGNLEALEAVLRDVEVQPGIQRLACLGDLVGYGPHPNEVVEVVKQRGIQTVLGCWDEGIAQDNETCGCSFVTAEEGELGARAFGWTRGEVYRETREFLGDLPFAVRTDLPCGHVLLVHGSPAATNEYLTDSTHELILFERAARGRCDILICGHTHVPFVKNVSGALHVRAGATLKERMHRARHPESRARRGAKIELEAKTIVNAGSVGEPRHGGLEATYVILDAVTGDVEIRAVAYDVERTARAMRDKGVDAAFVDRLLAGREMTDKVKEIACAC
jgi:predicted phosphodiesterase